MSSKGDHTSFEPLDELREGLLIRYERRAADDSFILVSTLASKSPASDREFARVRFGQILDFERERGQRPALQHFEEAYWTKLAPSPTVIEAIEVHDAPSTRPRITLWFGYAFGGVLFKFETWSMEVRASVAEERAGEFVYFDAQTGATMDFYDPFDDGPIELGKPR